jgi:hypothetical protein
VSAAAAVGKGFGDAARARGLPGGMAKADAGGPGGMASGRVARGGGVRALGLALAAAGAAAGGSRPWEKSAAAAAASGSGGCNGRRAGGGGGSGGLAGLPCGPNELLPPAPAAAAVGCGKRAASAWRSGERGGKPPDGATPGAWGRSAELPAAAVLGANSPSSAPTDQGPPLASGGGRCAATAGARRGLGEWRGLGVRRSRPTGAPGRPGTLAAEVASPAAWPLVSSSYCEAYS